MYIYTHIFEFIYGVARAPRFFELVRGPNRQIHSQNKSTISGSDRHPAGHVARTTLGGPLAGTLTL